MHSYLPVQVNQQTIELVVHVILKIYYKTAQTFHKLEIVL